MTKLSVTIGIPAYNEAANLTRLLGEILAQRQTHWRLSQILVYSDGSSDTTNSLVRHFPSPHLKLIAARSRGGLTHAEQQIIRRSKADILVLLNADVSLTDLDFIHHLTTPFLGSSRVGLTAARVLPLPSSTFLGRIIDWSHLVKTRLYSTAPAPLYLCHGRARALSHTFYSKLTLPPVIANDAYTYLRCRELGWQFVYQPRARVYFRSPATLGDHLLQSRRFFRSHTELSKYFPRSILSAASHLPLGIHLHIWARAWRQKPLLTTLYLLITFYSAGTARLNLASTGLVWHPSATSKHL